MGCYGPGEEQISPCGVAQPPEGRVTDGEAAGDGVLLPGGSGWGAVADSVTFMPVETSCPPETSVSAKRGSYYLSHEVSMEIETK